MLRIVIIVGCTLMLQIAVGATSTPFSVDSLLKMEGIHRVAFSPNSTMVVFERSPPWREQSDFSIAGPIFDRLGSSRIYAAELDGRGRLSSKPSLLFDHLPNVGYWVDDFSPDGRWLAISWITDDGVYSGVVDVSRRLLIPISVVSRLDFFQSSPIWVNDSQIVYATQDRRAAPGVHFPKRAITETLQQDWRNAKYGATPSVRVLASGDDSPSSTVSVTGEALVLFDVDRREISELASGNFAAVSVSPDGRYLATLEIGPLIGASRPSYHTGTFERNAHLRIIDVHTGETFYPKCGECSVLVGTIEWSNSGTSVLFFAKHPQSEWKEAQFHIFDLSDGSTTAFPHRQLDLASELETGCCINRPVRAIPVGDSILVYARTAKNHPNGVFERKSWSNKDQLGRADWYLIEPTGESRNLTRGLEEPDDQVIGHNDRGFIVMSKGSVFSVSFDADVQALLDDAYSNVTLTKVSLSKNPTYRSVSRRPVSDVSLFRASDRNSARYFQLVENGSGLVEQFRVAAHVQVVAVSPDVGSAVGLRTNSGRSTMLLLLTRNNPIQTLATVNTHLERTRRVQRSQLGYRFAEHNLVGCTYYPWNWRATSEYPVIVHVYPNRTPICGTEDDRVPISIRLMTGSGYIVFVPHTPRNLAASENGPQTNISDLVLSGVNELIELGIANEDKLFLYGESQGAVLVPWILVNTDRFAAAVSAFGFGDYASHFGQLSKPQSVLPQYWFSGPSARYASKDSEFHLGGTPWEVPDQYVNQSSYFNADKIYTPLMMINGELDWIATGPNEQLFSALYYLRRPAQLVTYRGEGHWLNSPANVRDFWARVFGWYEHYMCDDLKCTKE